MKLLFKQRLFSWLDSFDIFDSKGNIYYRAEGRLSWGHMFKIFDSKGNEVAVLKEEILTFLPRFSIYIENEYKGCVRSELYFLRPKYKVDMGGYDVEGNITEWNYRILKNGVVVSKIRKELFNLTDTYSIDANDGEELVSLLVSLAIDAIKCHRK